jgi:hypothetical protein
MMWLWIVIEGAAAGGNARLEATVDGNIFTSSCLKLLIPGTRVSFYVGGRYGRFAGSLYRQKDSGKVIWT